MSRRRAIAIFVIVLTLGAGALVALRGGGEDVAPDIRATIAVREALGGDDAGFARALAPRRLAFPEDHGPHPDFRTEWWYYTGNLQTAAGRHFGFQLTFFRNALAPLPAGERDADRTGRGGDEPAGDGHSAWATHQLFLAHFAVTDTAAGRFHAASRLTRQALGLAGAQARPFRVWVEDWSVEGEAPDGLPVRLRAANGDVAIDLRLSAEKQPVLQGERGLSRKGREPGNASYYYSFTRMTARGTLSQGGESFTVSGQAWMDREWSTSALGPDLVGWDWFAFQLDDGRDLMFYVLRRRDGAAGAFSAGTLVATDGRTQSLGARDVTIEVLQHWTSPRSRVRYPARWRVTVPLADVRLDVAPRLADQELIVGTRYWEGAVTIQGSAGGRPISGKGYVELVGYGE